ncbi:PaaI family thioesterase, partial [Leptospira kanakyensis]
MQTLTTEETQKILEDMTVNFNHG